MLNSRGRNGALDPHYRLVSIRAYEAPGQNLSLREASDHHEVILEELALDLREQGSSFTITGLNGMVIGCQYSAGLNCSIRYPNKGDITPKHMLGITSTIPSVSVLLNAVRSVLQDDVLKHQLIFQSVIESAFRLAGLSSIGASLPPRSRYVVLVASTDDSTAMYGPLVAYTWAHVIGYTPVVLLWKTEAEEPHRANLLRELLLQIDVEVCSVCRRRLVRPPPVPAGTRGHQPTEAAVWHRTGSQVLGDGA